MFGEQERENLWARLNGSAAADERITEQSGMKTFHLVTRSLHPKGTGPTRWARR